MAGMLQTFRPPDGIRAFATGVSQHDPPEGVWLEVSVEPEALEERGMIFAAGPQGRGSEVAPARVWRSVVEQVHHNFLPEAPVPEGCRKGERGLRSFQPVGPGKVFRTDRAPDQSSRVYRSARAEEVHFRAPGAIALRP